ncbi:pyridoxamine 5'-phosphate oxidase family protein [Neorhizobium sp. CSC1952]|uniref:HugZ family pyridoxamine 5'-phosphate oxidase n=1 Tax=Neorhizobium sp. CSC1952 TaxID=2978974 RepID=UPI0025A54B33|nr:pyridoxamine 5'-phosphate oxidase family protein [Rhizobium sp. CSC1952]WJR65943.1 pyridoxamine 5'-phosphate oxidase family protein [Rhizobium sp. CSC1952]
MADESEPDESQAGKPAQADKPPQADQPPRNDEQKVLRDTDDEARRLARTLVRGARYMALAVLDPETGFPSVSRALTGTDVDGVPVILVSGLSGHTKGLVADPRCSLLAGEPGKGDPLAHPRITVQCLAESVARDTPEHARIRRRFLDRHPKAALYADFGDFRFVRITPQNASLNGGFGRAYLLSGDDLVIREPGITPDWLDLSENLVNMTDQAEKFAAHLHTHNGRNWRFAGVDRAGIDLIAGDFLLRHEFEALATSPQAVLDYVFGKAKIR